MKILLLKRDKIGDMLLSTAMLEHLRETRPELEIHVLANDYNAWVLEENRCVDRLWVYPRTRSGGRLRWSALAPQILIAHQLRREKYDAAIVANGDYSRRGIRRILSIKAKRSIAYCDRENQRGVTDPLSAPRHGHEIERLFGLLEPLNITPPKQAPEPHYHLPHRARIFAEKWLSENALSPGQFLVLGLGARQARRQPDARQILRWATWCKQNLDLDTVFMWTPGRGSESSLYPGDDKIAEPVLDHAAPFIHPFRGPILEAIGLIWHARTSVFPDSGLMHFAAASPGGVVGLFADNTEHFNHWRPWGSRACSLNVQETIENIDDEELFAMLKQRVTSREQEERPISSQTGTD